MKRTLVQRADRVVEQLPGWMLLAAGMAIIAAVVLTPPWLNGRRLDWQRGLMKLQATRLGQQEQAYRQFTTALDNHDPLLLQRLAYQELHLKPSGTNLLTAIHPGATPTSQPFEAWLYRPMPKVGVDYPAYRPIRSCLVRLTTGPARLGVLGLGVLCIVAGLMMPMTKSQDALH